MEQHEEINQRTEINEHDGSSASASVWLIAVVVVALVIAATAFGYGYSQQAAVHQLTAQAAQATEALNQTQDQVSSLTSKLNDLSTAQQAVAQAAAAAAQNGQQSGKKGASGRGPSAADKRYKQFEAQLADEHQQLKATQDQVAKNLSDLEGNLNSTRDNLNGAVAHTHEELVALERRSERSFFEFDLNKSGDFQRIGPLSLSLRKADTKHKNYDLAMLVDDNRLSKKKVNLYEPIWIHTETDSQPLQIVVNQVQKNRVHGYVSAPKYTASTRTAKPPAASPDSGTDTPDSTNPDESRLPRRP